QLRLGLVHTGDVVEGRAGAVLHNELGAAAAEVEDVLLVLRRATRDEEQQSDDEHDGQEVEQQPYEEVIRAGGLGLNRDPLLLQAAREVDVVEERVFRLEI